MKKLPTRCPSCESKLQVVKLSCESCQTEVSGNFPLPIWTQLSLEEQAFVLEFILQSGSLKEMAKKLNKSYPTVRNKLDDLIEILHNLKED